MFIKESQPKLSFASLTGGGAPPEIYIPSQKLIQALGGIVKLQVAFPTDVAVGLMDKNPWQCIEKACPNPNQGQRVSCFKSSLAHHSCFFN